MKQTITLSTRILFVLIILFSTIAFADVWWSGTPNCSRGGEGGEKYLYT
ncbi:MAG: hypothetical protein KJ697_02445 [Nanoarchaeota archaeon]|nr:hypothetical protein [Nanoarchaeota archaeon]MBU4123954.1 hypothetical protein [Nanoarchaeota archaeon]